MSRHRQAELDMLLDAEFARQRESRSIALITYSGLIVRQGRSGMRRPQ